MAKRETAARAQADDFSLADDAALAPLLDTLAALRAAPPQTLLLEGGNAAQRLMAAKYWAALHNCGAAAGSEAERPCLSCAACRQIEAGEYSDLHILDGRISNAEDEDDPGPVKALNMRRVRELKSLLANAPRGAGKRIVILQGMPLNRDNAANALLKVLEDPAPFTLFVLLAPQREQLLPTLVSRSFALTLPWPDPLAQGAFPFREELAAFLEDGKNLLDKFAQKGAADAETADQFILGCQKTLMRALGALEEEGLEKKFSPARDAQKAADLSRWLAEARRMLQYSVNPARVLEALCARLFCALR